jgi:hypothetical protein
MADPTIEQVKQMRTAVLGAAAKVPGALIGLGILFIVLGMVGIAGQTLFSFVSINVLGAFLIVGGHIARCSRLEISWLEKRWYSSNPSYLVYRSRFIYLGISDPSTRSHYSVVSSDLFCYRFSAPGICISTSSFWRMVLVSAFIGNFHLARRNDYE